MTPLAPRRMSSSTGVSWGSSSEYTLSSRTRRAMSCANWEPKSSTTTLSGGSGGTWMVGRSLGARSGEGASSATSRYASTSASSGARTRCPAFAVTPWTVVPRSLGPFVRPVAPAESSPSMVASCVSPMVVPPTAPVLASLPSDGGRRVRSHRCATAGCPSRSSRPRPWATSASVTTSLRAASPTSDCATCRWRSTTSCSSTATTWATRACASSWQPTAPVCVPTT